MHVHVEFQAINSIFSTGNSSQSIWLDNVNCASSSYNCIAKCASCPSAEYHNCGHNEDVTIECGMSLHEHTGAHKRKEQAAFFHG